MFIWPQTIGLGLVLHITNDLFLLLDVKSVSLTEKLVRAEKVEGFGDLWSKVMCWSYKLSSCRNLNNTIIEYGKQTRALVWPIQGH